MAYFSDKALAAAVEAMKPDHIQGFTYGTQHVIRDVYRPWEAQVLWRGPAGLHDPKNQHWIDGQKRALDVLFEPAPAPRTEP